MRTTVAIGCVVIVSAGCGGEVTAAPQRSTSDTELDATVAARGDGGSSGGVAEVPDAQSDSALEPPVLDDASALTGASACAAAGGRCDVDARCKFQTNELCGPGVGCCLDVLCTADAAAATIQASDYDQTCAIDSDCAEVAVGDGCTCEISCQTALGAINRGALPQYTADFDKLPHVICECPPALPPCPGDTFLGPHCVGGTCQYSHCSSN